MQHTKLQKTVTENQESPLWWTKQFETSQAYYIKLQQIWRVNNLPPPLF